MKRCNIRLFPAFREVSPHEITVKGTHENRGQKRTTCEGTPSGPGAHDEC